MDILNTLKSMENWYLFNVVGPPAHIPLRNMSVYFSGKKENSVKLKLSSFPKITSLGGFHCEKSFRCSCPVKITCISLFLKITSLVGFHCEKELLLLILCCITWHVLIMKGRD
jgi:hypothetical protein